LNEEKGINYQGGIAKRKNYVCGELKGSTGIIGQKERI